MVLAPPSPWRRPEPPPERPLEPPEIDEPDSRRNVGHVDPGIPRIGQQRLRREQTLLAQVRTWRGPDPFEQGVHAADRHMMSPGQLLDPQRWIGQVLANMPLHHVQQHPGGTLSARHRGCDAPQRHREQFERGPPGVQPLRRGEIFSDIPQPAEIAGQKLRGRDAESMGAHTPR
nr:hypothetical protein [Pseudonocardia alaniniphila]